MTIRAWWRRVRSRFSLLVAVGLWGTLVLVLGALALWRVAPPTSTASASQTWAHETLRFYDAMLPVIVNEAERIGAVRIQIHPERNATDTLCAAPCNDGLAEAICQHYAEPKPQATPEVLFWDQPPALRGVGEAWLAWRGSLPDHVAFRRAGLYAGWYHRDVNGGMVKAGEPRDDRATLHLSLYIDRIVLDREQGEFQAQFSLFGGSVPDAQAKLVTQASQGDLTQVRWFTRTRSNQAWRFRANAIAFSVLTAILLVLMIPWVRTKLDDFVEARISVRCTAIGVVFGLVWLVLTPVVRERVDFYERANLFFLVDRNSEIWVSEDAASGDKGIPYLAGCLEQDVNDKVVNPPPALSKAFPRWLWEECVVGGWKPVFRPERYSLNRPFVLQVFGFSGTENSPAVGGTDWIPLGTGGDGVVRRAIESGALSLDLTCVARRLCPQTEPGLAAAVRASKEANQQRMPPSFVLLLTGLCASSPHDQRNFLDLISAVTAAGDSPATRASDETLERCANMHVFTVLVPSLPRSGGGRDDDYADGKHVLATLFSERVVALNAPADPTWMRDIAALEQAWRGWLPQPTRPPGTEVQRITLNSPVFDLPRLTSSHRDFWDMPRDLDRLRTARAAPRAADDGESSAAKEYGELSRGDYRLLAAPAALETASEEIAEEFRRFVRDPDRLRTMKSIHVIGRTPWPYWLLGAGFALLLGAWAFCLQYENDAYRRELNLPGWKNLPTAQVVHRSMPAVALAMLVLTLLIVLWQSEDPQVWISAGEPAWAFCAGVLFWAGWVVVPHVYFREFERSQSASLAGWRTVGFALGFVVLVLAVQIFLPSHNEFWRWCRFLAIGGAALAAAGLCAQKVEVYERGTGTEFLAWWRKPPWSALLICVLAILLLALLRGALPAGPVGGRGVVGGIAELLARVDFVGFIALTVWLVSGIGFGIAFTQHGRWSLRRALFWLVPLLAAGYSSWLFLV
jgi:hypothetical protein